MTTPCSGDADNRFLMGKRTVKLLCTDGKTYVCRAREHMTAASILDFQNGSFGVNTDHFEDWVGEVCLMEHISELIHRNQRYPFHPKLLQKSMTNIEKY